MLVQNLHETTESVTLTSTGGVTIRLQAKSVLAVYTRSTGSTVMYWDDLRKKIAATQSRAAVATACEQAHTTSASR